MNEPFCSHVWIDPTEPPIERQPYSPAIGPLRHEMKPGREYVCRNCAAILCVPTREQLFRNLRGGDLAGGVRIR